VLTDETGGNFFAMEQSNHKKGGPPRHLHYNEEGHFYVIEGNYVVEVDTDRFELGPGDSLLAPRKIPHAWAFVGDDKGRLLISFAPTNKMEAYFRLINQIRAPHTYADPNDTHQADPDATVWNGTDWAAAQNSQLIMAHLNDRAWTTTSCYHLLR
jgi:quercetin dioxygenase-like cupin family protein